MVSYLWVIWVTEGADTYGESARHAKNIANAPIYSILHCIVFLLCFIVVLIIHGNGIRLYVRLYFISFCSALSLLYYILIRSTTFVSCNVISKYQYHVILHDIAWNKLFSYGNIPQSYVAPLYVLLLQCLPAIKDPRGHLLLDFCFYLVLILRHTAPSCDRSDGFFSRLDLVLYRFVLVVSFSACHCTRPYAEIQRENRPGCRARNTVCDWYQVIVIFRPEIVLLPSC